MIEGDLRLRGRHLSSGRLEVVAPPPQHLAVAGVDDRTGSFGREGRVVHHDHKVPARSHNARNGRKHLEVGKVFEDQHHVGGVDDPGTQPAEIRQLAANNGPGPDELQQIDRHVAADHRARNAPHGPALPTAEIKGESRGATDESLQHREYVAGVDAIVADLAKPPIGVAGPLVFAVLVHLYPGSNSLRNLPVYDSGT